MRLERVLKFEASMWKTTSAQEVKTQMVKMYVICQKFHMQVV